VIAVDWGTTSFRAYRLDTNGAILETRVSADGILSVKDFPQTLERQIAGWSERPVVMSGMVGSRQGWQEAPYVECPAGPEEISRGMQEVESGVWIVPGVVCREGVADVMRGEETQILGCGVKDGVICLPGTHSKWVEVRAGRIMRFTTHMTGEVFAVMKAHSILGRMMEAKEGSSSFLAGVERSGAAGGLLHHLFGVRTRALMNEAVDPGSYLSGILVGHELRAAATKKFSLLGTKAVASLYEQAAAALDIECRTLEESAAARGLHEMAKVLPRGNP
jgi:2-dehydro-3-deoxygalactonokinase